MRAYEFLVESNGFSHFIADLYERHESLHSQLQVNRQFVIGGCRRALRQLANYKTQDAGEQILIEVATEDFEALLRQAGGSP